MARNRKLSRADPSDASLLRFLAGQSDVILLLCGGPAIWHLARQHRAKRRGTRSSDGDRATLTTGVSHQLRQVFTVLLLGLGMIARKAGEGKTAELLSLVRRLQQVTRMGAYVLAAIDEPADTDGPPSGNSDGRLHVAENGLHP
jgi:hypothetical protein